MDSDYESENDNDDDLGGRLDDKKLKNIKTLLFNTHRVKTGEDKLNIGEFIGTI